MIDLNAIAESLGNKIFAIETNLSSLTRRIKGVSNEDWTKDLEPIYQAMRRSLEELKDIKTQILEQR